MLNVNYAECHKQAHCAECHFDECRYAECRYAQCRGTLNPVYFSKVSTTKNVLWRWHQNAGAVVVLASDELLGDEVHAVAQRCDECDVSVTVKGGKVILKCFRKKCSNFY
jgi:hypothetical protein